MMRRRQRPAVRTRPRRTALLNVVILLVACTIGPAGPIEPPIPRPYWPTEGWQTSSPEARGMDSVLLADMLNAIQWEHYAIDSVLVVRNGYLVLDAYVYPFHNKLKHNLYSAAKSVTSALVGIALDQGHIKSIEQPVLDFFPKRAFANVDENKKALTLEHLLMMATGLPCGDTDTSGQGPMSDLYSSEDWVQFLLDLPVKEPPGTRFEYCSAASFLLSAIVQERTGMTAAEFAQKQLFGPLGIEDAEWPANAQGITIGWGRLQLHPHDMAKIGYLYLNKGYWDGRQIVSQEWVEASTHQHIARSAEVGYGYQWWVIGDDFYMASGRAGQYIFVVPEQDLVVVFTSQLGDQDAHVPIEMLLDYILPAAKSSTALPENPEGLDLLKTRVEELTREKRQLMPE